MSEQNVEPKNEINTKDVAHKHVKKSTIVIIVLVAIVLAAVCSIVAISAFQAKNKEWTYDLLQEEFGGVIEVADCDALRNCLNLLSWEEYYVCGYVADVNSFSPNILTLSDNGEKEQYIVLLQGDDQDTRFAEVGDFVYANGKANEGTDCYYLYGSAKRKYIKEYLSVNEYLSLMKKIYEKTYFKTTGIIFPYGENYDGSICYRLYPSEEAYEEEKYLIDVTFLEGQNVVIGKRVTILGKPDTNALFQGLKDCSIS